MTDTQIFEEVAAGKLKPAAGAAALMQAREADSAHRRPAWMPRWVFAAGGVLVIAILGALGVRVQQDT